MLLKMGVSVRRLRRRIRRALPAVEGIFREFGYEAVLTSTDEGNHSPGSLHYAGLAVDVRLPPDNEMAIVAKLKVKLGHDYDVVHESNHIHIEYDPKSLGNTNGRYPK